jgi:hypothetical protein
MNKSSTRRSRRRTLSNATIAATVLAVPMLSAASPALARSSRPSAAPAMSRSFLQSVVAQLKYADVCLKLAGTFTIVGLDKGHTIYKNAATEGYFYLDPATGDMKVVSSETYIKQFHTLTKATGQAFLKMTKLDSIKMGGNVKLLGVDAQGHVVQQNSRGEKFYLDAQTGDMVRVK